MTISLTYGHGLLLECDSTTGWTRTDSADPLTSPTIAVDNRGSLKLAGTCDSVADEYAYWTKDITDFNSSTYNNILFRYKTSVASSGLQSRVDFKYTPAGLKNFVSGFSPTWNIYSGTLDTGMTVDKINIWADDNPDSIASGTFQTYYDFILAYAGTFTFPFASEQVTLSIPNSYIDLPIPGGTPVTQFIGSGLATIRIEGEMEQGSWGDPQGDIFYKIWHEACSAPWQWFECTKPEIKCKVKPISFTPSFRGGGGKPTYVLLLEEYRDIPVSAETYGERFGHSYA